jgi:hypothetical protein
MEKAINILVDISYDLCVMWLMDLAHYTGLSYREVNFVVFMIVLPLVLLVMFLIIVVQHVMLRKYASV